MAFRLSTGQVRVRVTDEAGRIDIGKAPVEVLTSLLRRINAENPDGLARDIVNWRTTVGGASLRRKDRHRPGRMPAMQAMPTTPTGQNQQAAGQPPSGTNQPNQPKPANKDRRRKWASCPFTDIRQLLNVPGVTPNLLAAATPFITVFGGDKLNALTASPPGARRPPRHGPRPGRELCRRAPQLHQTAQDAPQLTQMLGAARLPMSSPAARRSRRSVNPGQSLRRLLGRGAGCRHFVVPGRPTLSCSGVESLARRAGRGSYDQVVALMKGSDEE